MIELIMAALAGCGVYSLACWAYPFAACWACKGDGKRRSPSGRSWRKCRRCKGTGERLRVGRVAWNWARRTFG